MNLNDSVPPSTQLLLHRRRFICASGAALAAGVAGSLVSESSAVARENPPVLTVAKLPRWRGFNLLEKFSAPKPAGRPGPRPNPPFVEQDFEWMAEWGFDFARLPLSYHCWASPDDWLKLDEAVLKEIDRAVEFGRRHGIHVNLNLHRAPGYCINPPAEPLDLWTDEKALEACAFHWAHFARRYKGIPNTRVSFDLLNEPSRVEEATYTRVVKRLVGAIHAEDPQRLVIADGIRTGNEPVHSLVGLVAQSTRGYAPGQISHYKASWVKGSDKWPEPTWPLNPGTKNGWDKDRLRRETIEPWKALEKKGVGIHVGEWGAFRHTPHAVTLAWMRDRLELWKEAGWGWALWNLRGSFGFLDSGREDVKYEEFRGHKLDRKMFELLRAF